MFRRLQSVLSPMSAMRIDPTTQTPESLEQKLHTITEYLINSTKQFDSWMQLQNNNKLHLCLFEIFNRAQIQTPIQTQTQTKSVRRNELQESQENYDKIDFSSKSQSKGTVVGVSEDELVNIIQFYTMLIINCKDQLLICKLVSDDFVVAMCRLHNIQANLAADLEAYRINLIKAYMSKINSEVVKYMVLQDKFKIFETCVSLYNAKIGSGTVEFTTISNTLLNVVKRVDQMPYLWQNVWTTQGLQLLLTESFDFILAQLRGHKQLPAIKNQLSNDNQSQKIKNKQNNERQAEQINDQENKKQGQFLNKEIGQQNRENVLNTEGMDQKEQLIATTNEKKQKQEEVKNQHVTIQQKQQDMVIKQKQCVDLQIGKQCQKNTTNILDIQNIDILQEIVLFLVELRNSVSQPHICQLIQQYSYLYLQDILLLITQYSNLEHWIYAFSTLFCLFKAYSFQQQAIQKTLQSHLQKLLTSLSGQNYSGLERATTQKMCRQVFILTTIISSKYSHFSQRTLQIKQIGEQKYQLIKQSRYQILTILINLIQKFIDYFEATSSSLYVLYAKSIMLSAFYIKLAVKHGLDNRQTDQALFSRLDQAILQLFLTFTAELKKVMAKSELWNNIMKWYEDAASKVSLNLLVLPDCFQHNPQDSSYAIMMVYEYIKGFRYMIVQHTTLDPKSIKQQKFYHSQFTSLGLMLEPGKITNQAINIVCPAIFHHNYQQIPVVILEDKECFIIGIKMGQKQLKILANIKFKDIDSLVYGGSMAALSAQTKSGDVPKFVRLNLRGSQQIVLEFGNPKIIGNAFKDYIIKSRDLARQRQLTFLNQWIKNYQSDTQKSLEWVKKNLKKQDYIVL